MSQQDYALWVKRAGYAAAATAILLIITKLTAYLLSGSASILASLTDSFMDMFISLLNLWVIRFALQPADENHRFGHGKAESLAGLAQAAFITGSAALLIVNGIDQLANPRPLAHMDIAIAVTVFSFVATLALVSFQNWVIRRTDSVAIKGDALHYRTDVFMNGAVLTALVATQFGWYWADGVMAILVAFYIVYSAIDLAKESVDALLDKALPISDNEKIVEIVKSIPKVRGMHDLRTRKAGPTTFIQLHIELPDDLSLLESHQITDAVSDALEAAFYPADVLVHTDPSAVVPFERQQQFGA